MHLKTCVILWYLFKTKIKFYTFFFYPFLGIFFNPPKHPNYKSYHSNFFSYRLALKNWAMNIEHAFQPYDYSPRPFSRGPLHRFRPPPAFIGFCLYTFWNLLFLLLRRFFLRPGKSSRHAFLVGQFVLTLLPQYPSVLRWPQSPNKHTM